MRPPVERYDTRAVHHLVQQHHVVRRLDQLDVLVVAGRCHRGAGIEAEQAADREHPAAEVFDPSAVDRRVTVHAFASLSLGRPLRVRLGCQRRHAPVRGIDDQRCLVGLAEGVAGIEPELVVVADDVGRLLVVAHGKFGESLGLEGSRFFIGEKLLVGQRTRTFERRQGAEVPDTVQIRRAPGRSWRLVCRGGPLGLGHRGGSTQQAGNNHRERRR